MKNKIKRGFLPIYSKDIRRLIGYCDTWGYGNKDTCKYVAEQVMEILANDYRIKPRSTISYPLNFMRERKSLRCGNKE
jgi:hypothetical protein